LDAEFANKNSDKKRVEKHHLTMRPWRKNGNDILVCGQHGRSEQWKHMLPVEEWMLVVTRRLKQVTKKRIILRPHPRFLVTPEYASEFSNVLIANPRKKTSTYDDFNFEEALSTCAAVVCHSSGPGSKAVMEGVPVFVSSSSLAWPVGLDITELDRIDTPVYPDREQWLNDLSYSEWTVEEIESGEPWKRKSRFLRMFFLVLPKRKY